MTSRANIVSLNTVFMSKRNKFQAGDSADTFTTVPIILQSQCKIRINIPQECHHYQGKCYWNVNSHGIKSSTDI